MRGWGSEGRKVPVSMSLPSTPTLTHLIIIRISSGIAIIFMFHEAVVIGEEYILQAGGEGLPWCYELWMSNLYICR